MTPTVGYDMQSWKPGTESGPTQNQNSDAYVSPKATPLSVPLKAEFAPEPSEPVTSSRVRLPLTHLTGFT
jgi:hypothetical protein